MNRILYSPGKYVQGVGVCEKIGSYLAPLGQRVFLLGTPSGQTRIKPVITAGLQQAGVQYVFATVESECTKLEIERLLAIAQSQGCDIIAGVGGGKVMDAAKAVAFYKECALAIVPTSAATDAPCSALSVLYKESGVFDEYLFLKQSPNLVLVDSAIIAQAPARLLVAGMGDALATYFEARALRQSGKNNQVGGKPALAATALAKLCYELLLANGEEALKAAKNKQVTPALENIIEANIYLSGVGFESGGLSAAHAVQKGFTVLPALAKKYHGEKVAFGTLVQLALENANKEEVEEVLQFCQKVGLPITFKQLDAEGITKSECMQVAEFTCKPGMTVHNQPFLVTKEMVCNALCKADAWGQEFIATGKLL